MTCKHCKGANDMLSPSCVIQRWLAGWLEDPLEEGLDGDYKILSVSFGIRGSY